MEVHTRFVRKGRRRLALVALVMTALTAATVGPVVPAAAAPSNAVLNWNATPWQRS